MTAMQSPQLLPESNDSCTLIEDACSEIKGFNITPVKIGVPFRDYCAMMIMGIDVSDLFYY